ncbi:MAG: PKD domain-containing protein [Bacteroidetes bacterium]|nr:PKD domain-containing protein [Bacteroidota bacterium]
MRLVFLALLASACIWSCSPSEEVGPAAAACLELSKTEFTTDDTITIKSCSQGALYTEIYVGDGSLLSKESEIQYSFKTAGTYTITLLAYPTDPRADITKSEKTVVVEQGKGIGNSAPPVACFKVSLTSVSPGQEITLLNCSEKAIRYRWDFGDGKTDDALNTTHSYEKAGKYTIKLTAYSPGDADSNSITEEINVGDKYLLGMELLSFAETKSSGETWDAEPPFPFGNGFGVEPDIVLEYGIGRDLTKTDVVNDATAANLPIKWQLDRPVKLDGSSWTFRLLDAGFTLGFPPTEDLDVMNTFTSTLNDKGADGIITLESGEYELKLYYEIR